MTQVVKKRHTRVLVVVASVAWTAQALLATPPGARLALTTPHQWSSSSSLFGAGNNNAIMRRQIRSRELISRRADDTNRSELTRSAGTSSSGGEPYTAKQRLREEIDSPFRKVRVVLFGFSAASALVALYFSILTAGKSLAGWTDVPPINVAATDVGVNVLAFAACAALTWRDVKAGEANLERIARGGALAALRIMPADKKKSPQQLTVGAFRNAKRVLVAAGGREYVETLAKSLLQVASELERVNVVVVPALLDDQDRCLVGETRDIWRDAQQQQQQAVSSLSSDVDVAASDAVVCFPAAGPPWTAYLAREIETARKQKFDPQTKGLGIYVKKNGRILRRATGQPNWESFIGTMDVMDGDKFGTPKF